LLVARPRVVRVEVVPAEAASVIRTLLAELEIEIQTAGVNPDGTGHAVVRRGPHRYGLHDHEARPALNECFGKHGLHDDRVRAVDDDVAAGGRVGVSARGT